ncbi:DUF1542 domain-containing protein [Lactobacillus amylovorus]|uniref:DUF1542 domain-containing protein n=2 Tax=Lactobacillus amylovorus TaxID=1604 RepID=UPI000E53F0A3|nr:DUF1542 domain-containing protein [Lactobacillus amylovorus]RGW83767.1 DUF1542 domain-containing protein [Lactobacillus amylovorus]
MSKNNFQERLRKMEDTKQRFSIRKFSIGAASVLIGLTIFGMGNETVHAAEQPAQNQNGGVQTSAVNKEESDASKAKQEAETSVNVNSEVTENMQEVLVDQKANTAQLEKKAPASAVKEEKTVADPTPAKEQNATSKQDSASAQTSQPAVDSVKQNAKKTQQAGNGKAALATTITLNEPKSSVVELTESKATVQDENSTTVVTSAKGLIDAIQKGTANTINIGANIDLGTISSYTNTNISNKRNIIIQSVAGKHFTVDFNGYGFNMYSSNYGVTFKNLDLYGRSYYGIVRSAGSYTFDNVNYTGAELIYTDPGYNTTVNFDGNVTAYSVGSYTAPLNGKLRLCQGGNNQQVIQFADGKNTINFNSGSNVTLTTTNSNVVEVDKGTTTINVKNGAQVSLNPHTQIFTEQHRMRMDGIARGIASDGNTTLNIDQGGNLDINLTKNTKDWYLSGALYLNSGATINVNGNLNINSNGKPYYSSQGWDDPVYINSNATINVNGGSFKVNATNMGDDYKGSIVTSNGKIAINHHGTFDVTGDGAKATGVSLGNGSTFTSTQPELFNISMPDGATAIKNGKVQFNGVKTSADSQPIGEIDITYASDGTPKVTKVTSYDEATTTATRTAGNNAKNKINLVAAGKEVDLKDIMFTKDADGNYIMSGIANTADNNGAYVYISVNGTVHQVAPTDSQTLYTVGETGDPTPSQVPYTAETGANGKFSVNLGKLKDTDQVSLYAAKDFVTSDTDTKTVSEWMTSFYRDQLQKLVDEASTVEVGSNYINATDSLKTAYTNAISDGSALLQNPSVTSEQLEAAATAITTAKTALNGDLNKVKQDLQAAVDAAPDFENTSATYYNAASAKQQAYNTAISAGSDALKAQNPTVESLTDALNKINDAKAALDGQPTNKQALQAAVNNSKDVKDSNNYANADQNAKTAYDNAVTAAQGVLGNSNATQAQVTQALQDLNTANDNLNGDAKTEAANRQALEDAVKEAPTVEKTDSKYYNGTEKAQDDYKNAVSEGQKVLDNANATADQIKTALDNINAAKGALDGDPTNKTILQNSVDNAVDLDKSNADAQAKKDYTDALNKAKQVLAYPNATQQAVNEANAALTNAKTALDNSSALQNAKDALQRAVDAKSTTEKTPAYYNAASAKQQAYNTAISAGSDALKAQNPTVESLTTALNKINEAKSALDGKATDTSKLKAAVDNANTVKASNDYKDASADDQKQYDDAVKAGQQLLDPTTAPSPLTQADVDRAAKAITDAQSALTTSATTNVKDAKGKATADLTNAVDAAKKAIDQDTNLTEDERNAAKAQVDSDASAAKEAINKATTNDAVTSAATAGKVTIDKTVANAAIDNAAAGKNKAIDGSSLTDEEKNGIKDQVAQAVKTAKDIISAADTEQAVTTAQKNGVAAIDGIKVPTESATKTAADKAIDEALANKQAEINKSTTLTDEEKANLNQQAQNAANTAKQNIANAKTDSAVATAQKNGVAAIDGIKVPTESATKTAADKAIDEALANKQAEINKSTTLTDEEKANLNQQAQNAANTAKQNIANAKTDSAVATAQDNGVAAIDGIKVSANSTAKDQAKSNITDAADKAKQTIDQDNNLTNDQKQAAKAQVDADAKTAQEAINKATTNDDVTSATNTGKLAIDKAVANAAIDNAVAGKKAEISNAKDLSSDDVKALNNEVDQAANDAKNAISSATTEKAVKTAQTDGVDKINAIDVATTAAKDKAKSDIDQTANDAKKAIDDNKDLTDDQKTAAKDQIDQDATKAKDNINNAKTDKDVEDANNAGQLAIAKDGAKAAIQGALNKKLNEIDSASALTSDEKAKLTNDANTAATNANKAIDAATTPIEVTSAQTAGIQDIENVKVPAESTTKDQAKSNITDAADKAKQTIDQDNNLTNDQKQAAKDQVDTDAKNAQDAIDNAKTDADVNNAADNGKIAIDKTVADAAIDNAVAGKIKDVKAPLTTDEQKTLTDLIKETGENAKQKIANATTPAEVTIAQDAGVNAIDQINVPTTSPVKDAADKAIDEALKNKTAAINKADNITDQEKHSLIDKVNKAADDATSAIKNATTDNAVKDAETKGLNEINGVTIPTLAEKQQAANVAIDQAAKAKKAEIAKALQAGNIDQAKADSLNTEVDNDVTNAMKAIANATTNAAVVVAQNDGIHKIKAIKVPSSTYNPDITNNTSTGSGDTDSTSTKPAEEATLKLILTHNAYIYNKDYQITYKDNKRVVLKKGTQIIALDNGKKYLIKGKEFYRIGDNQYVKVSNTISYYYLVHNSFLYNKHGKTIKRNGKRILVRKGVRLEANKVKVVKINGKKFYKVGKSTYIKFRNVKLIISPNN